jgi:hypothetical protein
MKAILVTTFLLSLVITISVFAEPGIEVQTSTDQYGHQQIRYVTPGSPGMATEKPNPLSNPTDQEVLWTVDHPTSVAENVDITGQGTYMLTGWYLNVERVSKY